MTAASPRADDGRARTYRNLQALRALAAVAVVVFHFGLMPATALPFAAGAAGVDLFFVLSGFVIAYSASRDPRRFLAHRLARVLPAYWIATAIAALFALPGTGAAELGGWLVQSLLLLPGPGGRPALIFVAWTLVYELAFYLLYRVALRVGPAGAPWAALATLVLLAAVPLPGGHGPWPLLLEFALGIGVYLATERGGSTVRLEGRAGAWLAVAGLAFLPLAPTITGHDPADYRGVSRVVTWGLPSALVVLGAVAAERGGRAVTSRGVLLLGAASYALYLLHPVAVGQLLALPASAPPVGWVACAAATAGIAAAAVAFHLWVEAPVYRRLRRALSRGRQASISTRARAG